MEMTLALGASRWFNISSKPCWMLGLQANTSCVQTCFWLQHLPVANGKSRSRNCLYCKGSLPLIEFMTVDKTLQQFTYIDQLFNHCNWNRQMTCPLPPKRGSMNLVVYTPPLVWWVKCHPAPWLTTTGTAWPGWSTDLAVRWRQDLPV